ncbi:hypothetical protein VPH35_132866 [Triticum aestivum]
MEPGGGRRAAAVGGVPWRAQLDGHRPRGARPLRQVLPPAVVQPALSRGGAQALHGRRGHHHRARPCEARQPLGRHRAPPPWPHRQRRQEPLELLPQAQARRRRRRRRGRGGAAVQARQRHAGEHLRVGVGVWIRVRPQRPQPWRRARARSGLPAGGAGRRVRAGGLRHEPATRGGGAGGPIHVALALPPRHGCPRVPPRQLPQPFPPAVSLPVAAARSGVHHRATGIVIPVLPRFRRRDAGDDP